MTAENTPENIPDTPPEDPLKTASSAPVVEGMREAKCWVTVTPDAVTRARMLRDRRIAQAAMEAARRR